MSLKPYSLGFVVGRFQLFHQGHQSLIDYSLSHAKETVVLIGSSDKSRSENNPFTFEERKEMLLSVYPDLKVLPLPDIGVGNVPAWGEYMISTIEKNLGKSPDLYVSGKEDKIDNWFSLDRKKQLTIVRVEREIIPVSASLLRQFVLLGEKEKFREYVSPSIFSHYEEYRQILLSIESDTKTK